MFSIPLFVFLAAYLIFLVIFLIFSAANVYNIYSTGTFTTPAVAVTILVSFWSMAILLITLMTVVDINWSGHMVFFGPGNAFITFE